MRFFPVCSQCQFGASGERRFSDEKSERKRWRFIIHRNSVLSKNEPVAFFRFPFSSTHTRRRTLRPLPLVYRIPNGRRYSCKMPARTVLLYPSGMWYTNPAGRLIHQLVSNYS